MCTYSLDPITSTITDAVISKAIRFFNSQADMLVPYSKIIFYYKNSDLKSFDSI
jgi:hypothetical protein